MWNLKLKISQLAEIVNSFFSIPKAYIVSHINDNDNVLTKRQSINRIIWIMTTLCTFLNFLICFLIGIVMSVSSIRYEKSYTLEDALPIHPAANQYLQVIYGDGYSLILQMTINLDLKIIKTNKYNYDPCGLFAFTSKDNLQTLVGSPGKSNYIHDFCFNGKRNPGNFVINLFQNWSLK